MTPKFIPMKIKKSKILFQFFYLFFIPTFILITIAGCDQPVTSQKYREVFIDAPEKPRSAENDPNAMFMGMPNDDVHAALRSNATAAPELDQSDPQALLKNMPNDNIHAGLRSNGMGNQNALMQNALMASVSRTPISWTAPQGWIEKKGTGMRLVAFTVADQNNPVETSIVSLAGGAGGLSANVTRWLQQLKLPIPADEELQQFIDRQEKIKTPSGLSVLMIDFTQLQKDAGPDTSSIIAAIIEQSDSHIFVKMTGTKQSVLKNLDSFKSLVNSITIKQ